MNSNINEWKLFGEWLEEKITKLYLFQTLKI